MTGNVTVKNLVDRLSKVENFGAGGAQNGNRLHEQKKGKQTQQVVAAFPYQAVQDDELSLQVEDVVEVIEEIEDGWNKGKLLRTGKIGMYPTNFTVPKLSSAAAISKEKQPTKKEEDLPVMRKGVGESGEPKAVDRQPSLILASSASVIVKEETKTKEMAKVKFTYEPQNSDELRLNEVGILINVLSKDCGDPGWYSGELNGRKGVFPDNFVELINVPINTPSGVHVSTLQKLPPSASKPPLTVPVSGPPSGSAPVPVLPTAQPPAVPAKPLKPKVLDTVPPVPSSAANAPPSSSAPAAAPIPSAAAASIPPKSANFAALRENLNKNFKPLNPDQISRSKQDNADIRPSSLTAEPGWSDETANDQLSNLSHVTKDRPRPPNAKRPASMMVLKKKESQENLFASSQMTISEIGTAPYNNSSSSSNGTGTGNVSGQAEKQSHQTHAPVTTSLSTGFTVTASIGAPASNSSPSIITQPKVSVLRPAFGVSAASDSESKQSLSHKPSPPASSISPSGGASHPSSDFVSRAEYNLLLDRIALLEQRLAILEKR
ncbi:hypothetical protein WR25_20778 [Diploscapter pachys]|uniref:SH3 domain-containing protein n=1 Tax=Diploscapter pachys TaxID=2018661 RepID=A0A2A2KE42_9BILA|nr:hypothetical protein WR25_20778 [Diploscapter pachys]